jgi:hypothetical protein
MGGGAANLDVGPVGFENPGHRVLAAPVVIIAIVVVIIVPVTHPLVVVLTVSHVSPLFQPWSVCRCHSDQSHSVIRVIVVRYGTRDAHRIAVQFKSASNFAVRRVQQRRVPQPPADTASRTNHSACQNKPRFSRVNFKRNIRLSFALRSRAAQLSQPSRSNGTWLLEPFTRGGLSL